MLRRMSDELWVPLVDEPIGMIVDRIQEEHAEIGRLVDSPRKLLKTFAYVRVGLVLGQLLVESDIAPAGGADASWVDELLRDSRHYESVVQEVRAVAEEVAADPTYADEEPIGPDDAARERFREFARRQLG